MLFIHCVVIISQPLEVFGLSVFLPIHMGTYEKICQLNQWIIEVDLVTVQ